MSLILSGTNGVSDIDGSASTPAIRGTDANTGIFFPAADTIGFAEGGVEAMRIDSAGNVGIGTSSPAGRLDVSQSAAGVARHYLRNTSNSVGAYTILDLVNDSGNNIGEFFCTSSTNTSAFGTNATVLQAATSNPLILGTNGTERMRIDSSGNLQLGYGGQTTTAFAAPQGMTIGSLDNVALQYYLRKGNQVEARIGFKASTDSNFYVGSGGGTGPGGIGAYGVYLTNLGSSWNAVSDERMKTIIEPIENAAEKVSSLRTVIGYYNNDESQTRRPFLIAQDVQSVLPEAVNIQNLETGTLGMSYTDTIPLLVAAIKEQQALITALTARITALEQT